jgi:hypothetical protein
MLEAGRFVAGGEYLGTLVVAGAGEQDLVVGVRVRVE